MSTDEFRFEKFTEFGESKTHKEMANGEPAISAGTIMTLPGEFVYIAEGSVSLEIFHSLKNDIEFLETLTKRKEMERV
jgi:hypothetical protein